MKKLTLLFLSALALISLAGCQNKEQAQTNKGLKVVTTFFPVYDFTQRVVGDNGEVSSLMNGEVEPHDYEPSAKDIAKIQEADVFVYSSDEMETWVTAILENIDPKKTKVIELAKGIEFMAGTDEDEHDEEVEAHEDEHEAESHEGHHHELDPHIWLSPVLAKQQVKNIYDGLITVDAKNKESYEEYYEAFIQDLNSLDKEYQTAFAGAKNKTFVTQHAAFGYLANAYGLTQESIAGLTPDAEPSAKQLAALETFVKEQGIAYIYVEQSGSSKMADTIAKATGAKVETLSTLETGTKDSDYLAVMRENLAALKKSIH